MKSKEWIKAYRTVEMNMTQQELADYLSIGIRTVQNWESRGTSETTIRLLQLIQSQNRKIKTLRRKLEDNNMTFELK